MKPSVGKEGERIGSYELVEHLGSGGNADVWAADGPAGRVAMKLLRSKRLSSEPYMRFVREVEHLRSGDGLPGVLPVLDAYLPTVGSRTSRAWLVMPLATPLRNAIDADGWTAEAVVKAVAEVAETLSTLAAKGIAHRDVKPENLYLYEGRVVVGDFGLVDGPDFEPLTLPGVSVGPLHFTAPELIRDAAAADGRPADVYSLGKTLWVLLAGQRFPPPGEHRLDVPALCLGSYVAHPRIASLDVLLERMTRHKPTERPTMDHVASDLSAWTDQSTVQPSVPVDLSAIARRVASASEGAHTEAQMEGKRREAVRSSLARFVELARPVSETVEAGLTVYGRMTSEPWTGPFNTDAMGHFAEVVGMLATTKMLGRPTPVSQALGMLVRAADELPSLKLWAGVADIPPAAQATFAVGAVVCCWGGTTRSLWAETRQAVIHGPSMDKVWLELVGIMGERLAEDLAAWATQVEQAASQRHGPLDTT